MHQQHQVPNAHPILPYATAVGKALARENDVCAAQHSLHHQTTATTAGP